MINLGDLRILLEAVQAGSLAEAARRIGIPPMAASRRLAALETELGVRLVHRTTRSLSLTPEGEAYFPHAQAMLDEDASGRDAIRPDEGAASGLLRITASAPVGRKIVTPMLSRFLRDHPALRVELILNDGLLDLAALGIDLALRIATPRDSTLIARRLADNPRGLYASPAYLSAHGTPRALADLVSHQCLARPGDTHWGFERSGGFVRQRIGGRFSTDSVDAMREASVEGLGIARLSAWYAAEDVASGRLVPLPLSDADVPAQAIWAVYPTARLVPPKVRLFITAMQAHLRAR